MSNESSRSRGVNIGIKTRKITIRQKNISGIAQVEHFRMTGRFPAVKIFDLFKVG